MPACVLNNIFKDFKDLQSWVFTWTIYLLLSGPPDGVNIHVV